MGKNTVSNAFRACVIGLLSFTVLAIFQNCGNINIQRQEAPSIVEPQECNQVYSVFPSWDPAVKKVQFFLMEIASNTSTEFIGSVSWTVDGITQSSNRPSVALEEIPNCSKKIFAIASFTNACFEKTQKGTDFLDPRCTTEPACAGPQPPNQTTNPNCPAGQVGTITEVTRFTCSDSVWKPVVETTNSCVPSVIFVPPQSEDGSDIETPNFPNKVCVDQPVVQEYTCNDTYGYTSMMYEHRLLQISENNTQGTASIQMIDWMRLKSENFSGEPVAAKFVNVASAGFGESTDINYSLCRGDFDSVNMMPVYQVSVVNGVEVKGSKIKYNANSLFGVHLEVYFGEKRKMPGWITLWRNSYGDKFNGQYAYMILPVRQTIFINFKDRGLNGSINSTHPSDISIHSDALQTKTSLLSGGENSNSPRCSYQKNY